jgi:hypothetical protein
MKKKNKSSVSHSSRRAKVLEPSTPVGKVKYPPNLQRKLDEANAFIAKVGLPKGW